MPARSVCLVTLSLSEAGPGRFGCQVSVTDIYHTRPYHTIPCHAFRLVLSDSLGVVARLPSTHVRLHTTTTQCSDTKPTGATTSRWAAHQKSAQALWEMPTCSARPRGIGNAVAPWRSLCSQRMATVIGGPWPCAPK